MFFLRKSVTMPSAADALPGRDTPIQTAIDHFVLGTPLKGPYPEGAKQVVFGMGCFWGAERVFWKMDGVFTTAVGYAAGHTPNPSYEEVCSGQTGQNEVVLVVYEPEKVSLDALLSAFWENHDPTQGMRQGNDVGTQYRSGIYLEDRADIALAEASRTAYQARLNDAGYGTITTEIQPAPTFYFAEAYHQQYLAKNPGGYCGLGGTGVTCPTGVLDAAS